MKKRIAVIAVFLCALGSLASTAEPPTPAPPEEPNAFEKFSKTELQSFRQYRLGLDKTTTAPADLRAKLKDYSRDMLSRYEKFRDSAEGTSYALEANREIITIALFLLGDEKKTTDLIGAEKNSERALRLKLHAAVVYGEMRKSELSRKLIEEVLAASEKQYSKVHDAAVQIGLWLAPPGLPFPEFPKTAKDLDGKPIRIADYKGKIVLVIFWAASCGPCMRDIPNLLAAYEKYHSKGFEILGISLDKTKEELLSAIKEKGMAWRQRWDGLQMETSVAVSFGIEFTPTMYLVGPDGRIVTSLMPGGGLLTELDRLLGGKK